MKSEGLLFGRHLEKIDLRVQILSASLKKKIRTPYSKTCYPQGCADKKWNVPEYLSIRNSLQRFAGVTTKQEFPRALLPFYWIGDMLEHFKVGFALHVLTRFNKSVLSYLLILQVMDEEKMDSLTLEVICVIFCSLKSRSLRFMNNRRQSESSKLPNSRCIQRAFIGVDGRNTRIQDSLSIFTDSLSLFPR